MRRWALAAMVTLESVTPAASLPRVFPVQGQRMSRSSSFWGPMGSAAFTVEMTRWVADALHLPHQVVGVAEAGVGGGGTL